MHDRLLRYACAVLLLVLAGAPAAGYAQQQPDTTERLTLRDIHASELLSPDRFRGGRWADEGPVITYIETPEGDSATHLMRYNLETDERARLIDGANLYAEDVGRLIEIEDYQYSRDRAKVLLYTDSERVWRYNTKGFYYVYDLDTQALTPIADRDEGYQMFARFNPAGTQVAFVRERNLFVVDLETGEVTPLTFDGEAGSIINGTFDWVYEEELGLRDGFRWSPGGRYIAFFKLDESQVPLYGMTNFLTRYPEYERFKYPKAGETNSEIKIGVIDMQSVERGDISGPEDVAVTYFDTNTWSEEYSGGNRYEYLAGMGWTPGADETASVWIYRLNREQNRLDLLYGDPATGRIETVLQEELDTYIDVRGGEKLTYLDDGEHFVWMSEIDGWNHLYLYENDGTLVGRLTEGDWEVTAFHGLDELDEADGAVYVTGTKESSIARHLYRVPFELANGALTTGEAERITGRPGWHSINMSPDEEYYLGTWSTAERPPLTALYQADGEQLVVLESNDELAARMERYDLPTPAFMQVPGADGTPLNAYVIKPNDFDSTQTYPLFMYVYGGPGAQTVTNRWPGTRGLWHRWLANNYDVIIASVDNRGTGGRGKAFQNVPYGNLGLPETKDQIAAAQHFSALPYIDEDRTGIWGWSYGGYMTLLSLLYGEGPQTFEVGLSVAPVTTWRFYDTIYTERYLSTPQKNPEGYDEGSPINYADRLRPEQDLLIVHGSADDNVHFQNTMQMVEALQEAGSQFELMVYPGHAHGIAGGDTRLHLFTMLTDFLEENLLREEEAELAATAD